LILRRTQLAGQREDRFRTLPERVWTVSGGNGPRRKRREQEEWNKESDYPEKSMRHIHHLYLLIRKSGTHPANQFAIDVCRSQYT